MSHSQKVKTLEEALKLGPKIEVGSLAKDLIGNKYEKLTVVYRAYIKNKDRKAYGVCKCDCGNYVCINGGSLRQGRTKSCGCIQKRIASEIGKQNAKDYTGQTINGFTFIRSTNRTSGSSIVGEVQRESDGALFEVSSGNIISGGFTGYGFSNSKGEIKISNVLTSLNLNFEREKRFKNCKDKKELRFDFYLPDYNCCIEYDGIQHFQECSLCTDTLEDRKYRDKIKNQYCLNNNINLIRIPYTDYDKLNEQYLKERIGL